jgi:uncharacterized membrane protein YhhN
LFLPLSILCGVAYFLTSAWQPFPGSLAIKGLSVTLLALYARKHNAPLLALGLLASSLGDMLLDVQGKNLFIPGLVAFLVAHIIYTTFFFQHWQRPLRLDSRQKILIGAVLVYAVIFNIWLAPDLGPLTAPVAFYICAITCMVTSSVVARSPWPVIAGAFLFLASDSLLAVAKFKGPFPLRNFLVWGTYYLAQYGISTGGVRVDGQPLLQQNGFASQNATPTRK